MTSALLFQQRGQAGDTLAITPLAGRAGLRVEGEADVANADLLAAAVEDMMRAGRPVLDLELSGLRFIDVTGARALMSAARRHPRTQVVLLDPPATLARMIGLLWPDSPVEIRAVTDRAGGSRTGC